MKNAPVLRSEYLPEEDLVFDESNPRFTIDSDDISQEEILRVLWRDFAVDELALSIAANGYFEHEPLFVAKESSKLVVIEGNRRLAAVRLLLNKDDRERVGATDLPKVSAADKRRLSVLPVVISQRDDLWEYIGFKHVNGPQAWQSYSKAQYIAWVHNELGVGLDDIATHIGDKHSTVKRFYRALMVLEQARRAGVFDVEDRWKKHFSFSHLYTGLDYGGIQRFLGITSSSSFKPNPVPKARIKELGELCEWLYGSRSKNRRPVVESQNPDLRVLDEVLQNKDGTAALRRDIPLRVSQDISMGDERLLRESLVAAKQNLQQARGRLLTGYSGESDLLAISDDIQDLATDIHDEMRELREKARRKTSANKKKATRRKKPTSRRKVATKRTNRRK